MEVVAFYLICGALKLHSDMIDMVDLYTCIYIVCQSVICHILYLFLHTVPVFNMPMDVMSEIKNA